MLTYVINTSENKIFDSNLLFELAGYNKIRWMHCSLDKVKECAIEICDKQNDQASSDNVPCGFPLFGVHPYHSSGKQQNQ